MRNAHPRVAREQKTIETMIGIYCRGKHERKGELCSDCRQLLDYARTRLEKCPFQENKSTCAKCTVHCYKPEMREKIRVVMRYSGPRMLLRHPVLAVMHLVVDGRRQPPVLSKGKSRAA